MGTTQTTTDDQPPLFAQGQIVATPTVLEHLEKHGINASDYLNRHVRGDWGEVPKADAAENDFALTRRLRLLSSYTVAKERIWILTEADRSVTTMLFPTEY
mgnify:CR=1 FL=1